MKTLIESTDTSATYQFTHGTATRTVTYAAPEDVDPAPNFEEMAAEEHSGWLQWLGVSEE